MKLKMTYLVLVALAVFALAGCSGPTGESVADANDGVNNAPSSDTPSLTDDPDKVVVYFFWGDGCPHCADEKPFLEEIEQKYSQVEVKMFETWKNPANAEIFQEFAQANGFQAQGVPTTFIGEEHWVGYSQAMGQEMESKIKECIENECPNPGDKVN